MSLYKLNYQDGAMKNNFHLRHRMNCFTKMAQ